MKAISFPFGNHRPVSGCLRLIIALAALSVATASQAQWQVVRETDAVSGAETPVAQVRNGQGYYLAIYRDGDGVVRARFALNDRLILLDEQSCPTYQIDERQPRNSSFNSESCMLQARSSEYVLGTIDNSQVVSRPLYELMNGSLINYRFRLKTGGYDQAQFSLSGSKRALVSVLGTELEVLPR